MQCARTRSKNLRRKSGWILLSSQKRRPRWSGTGPRQSMMPPKMTCSITLPAILRRPSAAVPDDELEIDELCATALNPDIALFRNIRKEDNRDIASKNRRRNQKSQELEAHREAAKVRYDDAVDAEQAMRRHLMTLQRQLRRARVHAAERQRFQQRAEKRLQLRNEMDVLWGLDVSLRLKEVQPASDVEARELSKLLNLKMSMLQEPDSHRLADPKSGGRWLRMFKYIDTDGSGLISFSEFQHFVRGPETGVIPGLGLGPKVLPDSLLSTMWRAMDEDAKGQITAGEFGKFMRLGRVPALPRERRVWMERTREEQRQRLEDREQRHVEEAVRLATENTRRLQVEAERIERALKDPDQLLGSKEPLRDGRVGHRFNGFNFADGGFYGGLPPAARSVGKIGSQRSPQKSPPRRLEPMSKCPIQTESMASHDNEDEYGFLD
mmetsp:Transcript_37854/g.121782  ORF Transcript_37854/g.121782 Transcript_37854/m.121782 type:complete len:438 (+) Transcript_37854:85-1398(+)